MTPEGAPDGGRSAPSVQRPPATPSGTPPGGPRRRDAERSRRAILDAAFELLTARGRTVPMYDIARRAGVGQATLYRHFPDREQLIAAVLVEQLTALSRRADALGDDPGAIFVLLRSLIRAQAGSAAIVELLHDSGLDSPPVRAVRELVVNLVRAPIDAAVSGGRLRPDFTPDDVVLTLAMVDGVLAGVVDASERAAVAERALELVLSGITTRF